MNLNYEVRALLASVRSDVGKVREINEDYVYVSETFPSGLLLAIVADGMGGHLAGEVASKSAVETVCDVLEPIITKNLTIEEYKDGLKKAIDIANLEVYEKSLKNDGYKGMGTTIVVAIISPEWIILGHIGDSRAYLINKQIVKQLTVDHSLVNELLLNGQISEEEASSHPQKNVITRALGTEEVVKLDIDHISWGEGETIILCTDGLSNYLSDEMLFQVVHEKDTIDETADHLVSIANEAGGNDNISLVIVLHG